MEQQRWIKTSRGLGYLFAILLMWFAPLAYAAGTLVQASTNDVAGYQVLAAGLDKLSNGNKIEAYLQQTAGDAYNYTPAPGFDGIVKVLDSANNVKATVNITTGHVSDPANHYLQDMSVASLLNGGFVVVWTELDNATSSVMSNFYAVFDNNGNGVGALRAPLATASGSLPQVVGLAGGGFATAIVNNGKAYINTFAYSAGNYVHNAETTVGDQNNPAPNPNNNPDIGNLYFMGELSLAALSDGNFVLAGPVYDYVSSGYTPLGDFVFKLSPSGAAVNFSSGVNYVRVNWSPNQVNDVAIVRAFNGGFASLNLQGTSASQWEVTVFNNDGTLVTTEAHTTNVFGGGTKTYYAVQFFAASGTLSKLINWGNGATSFGNGLASLGINASNLVAVLPNSAGGFSLATISSTTGLLVGSVVDSGITEPSVSNTIASPARGLVVPYYLADGSGHSILYSASGVDADPTGPGPYYVHSDLYQFGLTAMPPSTDAALSGLGLSAGSLVPSFSSGTTSYTVAVANSVTSISVTPTAQESHANLTVNGATALSGTPSGAIALSVGSNPISIEVTAQDGVTTATYAITVTRAASSNASLSALSISAGALNPAFASGTTSYSVGVTHSTASISVTPTALDAGATVVVNGSLVSNGNASGNIDLNVGINTITITVTAADGVTTASYAVTVTRAASGNADLSSLSLSSGTLSPVFAAGTTSYTASVPNATSSITVTPTVADATATVTVNGSGVASGTPSGAIALNVGSNTITVVVAAQDGTPKIYTATVTRATPSTNAALSALSLSSGTLSPVFAAGTTSYAASVPNATSSITVTPTVADATATVTVNGSGVASGTPSGAIALNVGSNTITVVVAAQDGTPKIYTATVTRATPSTNAALSALSLSSGTLSPVFAAGTTSYAASVPNATSSITVTPTVADATATVTVNGSGVASGTPSGAIALNVGSNTITAVVTAQDGATTVTYTVNLTRSPPPSTVSSLSALVLSSGSLTPGFAPGTLSYTVNVGNGVNGITLTPSVTDANATVTVDGLVVSSGSASSTIGLNVGANTITVAVTAQDGVTSTSYVLTVSRSDVVALCGSAGGATTVFVPSSNLCLPGSPGTVTLGASSWNWTCTAPGGNASCSAPKQSTSTFTGLGSASVASTNGWVIDAVNSPGFIPVTGHAQSPAATAPVGYTFPHGLFDFKLNAGAAGSSASVTINYPTALPPGTVYWKYGPEPGNLGPHWYEFPGAVISSDRMSITLTIQDGAQGDSDLATPGSISDPGGPGVPLVAGTVGIPTLSEWATLALIVLLACTGAGAVRHRRMR